MWVEFAMVSWAGRFHLAQLQEFTKIIQGLPPSTWKRAKTRGPHTARLDNRESVHLPRNFPPGCDRDDQWLAHADLANKILFPNSHTERGPRAAIGSDLHHAGKLQLAGHDFHNISRHSSTRSTATTLDIACLGEARMEACAGMCSKGWPSDVNQPTNSSISGQLSAGGFGPISHLVRRDLPNASYKASENKDRKGRQPTASARQSHAKREKKKQRIAVGPATILSLQQQVPP